MALSEKLKANLQANTEYYKANKDRPVRPEWGFPSTLDQVESELQKSDISIEDKKLLLDWIDAFSQIKIENDTTAEARRDKIKSEMDKLRGSVSMPTMNVQNSGSHVLVKNQGIKEVKEALVEINPDNLEKAVSTSEKFINLLPEGDAKTTLRGIHGAIIFDILRNAGHNLIMKNGQIEITPKPGTDIVNLQEKLQTLVNTNRISLDTIKIGMLYSSPTFAKYADMKKVKDMTGKEMIDPKASGSDFIQYIKDLEKAGNKSEDIASILGSQAMLQGVNMQKAIKGFKDMGQIGTWAEKNSEIVQNVSAPILQQIKNEKPGIEPSNKASEQIRPDSNSTLTGQFTKDGITKGHVTGVVGDAGKGIIHGIKDIFSLGNGDPLATVGIGAILIYGVYKMFQKFGFLGGFGSLLGLGALNNIEKIGERFGVDVSNIKAKAKNIAQESKDAISQKISGASPVVGVPKVEVKPENPKESPSQKMASDGVRSDTRLKSQVESLEKTPKNAKIEDYISFINTQKTLPVSLFVKNGGSQKEFSIFSTKSTLDPAINLPDNFDPLVFKDIMRKYLTGISMPRSELNTTYKAYNTTITSWEEKFAYTDTLIEATSKIYK